MAAMCIMAHMFNGKLTRIFAISSCLCLTSGLMWAQDSSQEPESRMRLPPVTVHVYNEPDDSQTLPVSVTAVPGSLLRDAGVARVSDAGIFAPNTFFSEFTARKLSNARFRGISSSPANPGITTFIDGVPQFNTNSSNIEFVDIEQVEFVRGAQSALFGRNTLGGLVSIQSARPPLSKWGGSFTASLANHSEWDTRASAGGPIGGQFAVRFTAGKNKRDGFTVNDITGNDLDYRDTAYGKAQLAWTPSSVWETRFIASGERDKDGDYGLNDLGALRSRPFHAARDFEGFTNRDIWSTTLQNRYEGSRLAFSSTTGFVKWKTQDVTDLDYTPAPLLRRDNSERDLQFTQEVRLASAAASPVRLGDAIRLRWQTGVFFFRQNYDQDAINMFSPGVLSQSLLFPIDQHSPLSELDDTGIGVYGQATTTFDDSFDLTFGARFDHESKDANLNTFFSPAISAASNVTAEKSFSNVSPNFAASYRFGSTAMLYSSVGRGFKAGGFNAASPAGNESYSEEDAWHWEGGVKSLFANGKVSVNAGAFFIDWHDLQLNRPDPNVPAQFYISSIGGARSKGVEIEFNARPHQSVDLFASLGVTHARFRSGTTSSGQDVAGNKLPSTPDQTFMTGAQYTRPLTSRLIVYGRGEVWVNGGFEYDDGNSARQESYSLANFRAGVRSRYVFVEAWLKNAFDARYIPIAFAYAPSLAPSGFLGEMGAPRRFGVTMGATF